jgi:hypothetical protein
VIGKLGKEKKQSWEKAREQFEIGKNHKNIINIPNSPISSSPSSSQKQSRLLNGSPSNSCIALH